VKIAAFFDWIDYDEDIEELKSSVSREVDVKTTFEIEELSSIMIGAEFVFIDYGAIASSGGSEVIGIERILEHLIDDNPSTQFVFVLTMGREYYKDSLFDYPNVQIVDRGPEYFDFLDKLI
jgi:hypothetical protein